ncbi:MAG TPA: hypothetical protein VGL76_09645 [Gaiellaceae bacterium]|jgi:intracellular septation protein A
MYRSNPIFTIYWVGSIVVFGGATIYFAVSRSYVAILVFLMAVYSTAIFAGGVLYGKGTLRNAFRAIATLVGQRR